MKSYNDDSDEGYFIETDVHCLEELDEIHNNLHFLPERVKNEKVEKLAANLHDKKTILYT